MGKKILIFLVLNHNITLESNHYFTFFFIQTYGYTIINEPRHEISNNVVCATSKDSDQPAHTRSLIRDFASCLNNL